VTLALAATVVSTGCGGSSTPKDAGSSQTAPGPAEVAKARFMNECIDPYSEDIYSEPGVVHVTSEDPVYGQISVEVTFAADEDEAKKIAQQATSAGRMVRRAGVAVATSERAPKGVGGGGGRTKNEEVALELRWRVNCAQRVGR
jgi:hypothetical protein